MLEGSGNACGRAPDTPEYDDPPGPILHSLGGPDTVTVAIDGGDLRPPTACVCARWRSRSITAASARDLAGFWARIFKGASQTALNDLCLARAHADGDLDADFDAAADGHLPDSGPTACGCASAPTRPWPPTGRTGPGSPPAGT